jgi:transcriptional regulator with XRE-family HTH domain
MPISDSLTFDVMSDVKFSADIRREFGRYMQQERESRGLTQKHVAEKIGITTTQLSRIENGKSGTERDTVILWAQTIGVDENEVLRRYKPENLNEDTYEIGFGIEVTFKNPLFSDAEKRNLLDSMEFLAAGVKTKKDEKTLTLEEAVADDEEKKSRKK